MTLEKDGFKDSSGHFVAGVAAGVAEWLIGHPLDTCVKQNNSIYIRVQAYQHDLTRT
jgi:hypothetical protein